MVPGRPRLAAACIGMLALAACGGDGGTAPTETAGIPTTIRARLERAGRGPMLDIGAGIARAAASTLERAARDGVRAAPVTALGPGWEGVVVEAETRTWRGALTGTPTELVDTIRVGIAILWRTGGEIVLAQVQRIPNLRPGEPPLSTRMVVRVGDDDVAVASLAGGGASASLDRMSLDATCTGFVAARPVVACDLGTYTLSVRADTLRRYQADGSWTGAPAPGVAVSGAIVPGVRRSIEAGAL